MTYIYVLTDPPPPLNNMFVNIPGKGRVKSHRYREWRRMSMWELTEQRLKHKASAITRKVAVSIHLPKATRGDVDGRVKGVLDALQDAGVIANDSQCDPVSIGRADVAKTTITIEVPE